MKTSIIIPYVRPDKVKICIAAAVQNAGVPVSDFSIVAEEDTERIGCPKMTNRMASKAMGDLIAFLGDDSIPQRNWLRNAIEDMLTLPDGWGCVGLNDKTGRDLACHFLIDQRMIPLLDGELYHEGYSHCYCDNELTLRSKEMGRYIYSRNAIVEHDHPALKGLPLNDEHYKRAYNAEALRLDCALFKIRRANKWVTPI